MMHFNSTQFNASIDNNENLNRLNLCSNILLQPLLERYNSEKSTVEKQLNENAWSGA